MKWKLWLSLSILVLSTFLFAEESPWRLGLGAGSPGVPSVMFQYWSETSPFMGRLHAGTLGNLANGAALDLGIAIDNSGNFRQFVGISGEANQVFWGLGTVYWMGGGPKYGVRYKGLYADIGGGVGVSNGDFLGFSIGNELAFFPMAHVGYSFAL